MDERKENLLAKVKSNSKENPLHQHHFLLSFPPDFLTAGWKKVMRNVEDWIELP